MPDNTTIDLVIPDLVLFEANLTEYLSNGSDKYTFRSLKVIAGELSIDEALILNFVKDHPTLLQSRTDSKGRVFIALSQRVQREKDDYKSRALMIYESDPIQIDQDHLEPCVLSSPSVKRGKSRRPTPEACREAYNLVNHMYMLSLQAKKPLSGDPEARALLVVIKKNLRLLSGHLNSKAYPKL